MISGTFSSVERRFGASGACLVFGIALLAVAAIYTAPSNALMNHGELYGAFASDPFHESLTSPIRLRPLSPWIAHFLFLRGQAFMAFPLLAAALFVAVVIRIARKNGLGGGEALLVGSLVALSSPVLFVLHFAGYVDTVSYLFIAVVPLGRQSASARLPYFGWRAFHGSLTSSILSNSTLTSWPLTFSTRRM